MQFTSEIKKNKEKSQVFKKFLDGVKRFEFEGGGGNKVNKYGKLNTLGLNFDFIPASRLKRIIFFGDETHERAWLYL